MWIPAPHQSILTEEEIHVYRAKFNPDIDGNKLLEGILSEDERQRAARLISKENRMNFIAVRGALRNLLGKYLRTDPASISFHYTDSGKPFLFSPSGVLNIFFNLSHKGRHALFAFGINRRLGIDLEHMKRDISYREIADLYFSDEEKKALNSLRDEELVTAFFRGWTRKEAYLKARGLGLPFGLKDFTVSILEHEPPALIKVKDDADQTKIWSVIEIRPWDEFMAALVCETKNTFSIKYFNYS